MPGRKRIRYKQGGTQFTADQVQQMYRLGFIHCSVEEVAWTMYVPISTLYDLIKRGGNDGIEAYQRGLQEGKASIRRMQFEEAKNGSIAMQIWLGKQYCGQSDQPQTVVNVTAQGGQSVINSVQVNKDQEAELERLMTGIQRRALTKAMQELADEESDGNGDGNGSSESQASRN